MNTWFPEAIILAAASIAAPQEGVRQMAGQWMAVAADTAPVVGPAAILIEITATTLVINAAEGDPLVLLLPDAGTPPQTSPSTLLRCGKPLPARWESEALTTVCDPDGDGTEAVTTTFRLDSGKLVVTVRYQDRKTNGAETIVQFYARYTKPGT